MERAPESAGGSICVARTKRRPQSRPANEHLIGPKAKPIAFGALLANASRPVS